MRGSLFHLTFLASVTALVMFTQLGTARLWDRDEPRNAGCALEMMNRGDLIVPIFNDELRHQKPVLLYWLIISAYQVFGVGEFAARFWSALLAIGTVLGTYVIGRRLLDTRSALLAGVLLATSMMFVVAGRAATPDSLLIFCGTAALMFYVLGTFASKPDSEAARLKVDGNWFPQKNRYVIAMYAMMGLGVLAKGPVGFVLPCAMIGMFMLLMRLPPRVEQSNGRGRLIRMIGSMVRPFAPRHFLATLWCMRPLTLVAVVTLVAAPWYVAVGILTEGDWPRIFFLNENLARATSSFEGHWGGLWYYPLVILVGFFPASIFLGPMIVDVKDRLLRNPDSRVAATFLICQVGVQVGLFSLAGTKLPGYITPGYPALALLTGGWLAGLSARIPARPLSWLELMTGPALIAAGVVATTALVVLGVSYLDGQLAIAAIGLILVVGAALMTWLMASGKVAAATTAFSATAVVFATVLFGFGTVLVDSHRQTDRILSRVAANQASPCVAAWGCLESSWVFYGGKPIYELTSERQSMAWRESQRNPWQKKDWPSPEQFVAAHPSAMFITTSERWRELAERLPPDFAILESAEYFLKDDHLVLIGRMTKTGNPSMSRTMENREVLR